MNPSEENLNTYFKGFEWNHNLPKFVENFFGNDRTWVMNALKCVLPKTLTEEELQNAAYDLWSYAQHHSLDLEEHTSEKSIEKSIQVLDEFFDSVKHEDEEEEPEEEAEAS